MSKPVIADMTTATGPTSAADVAGPVPALTIVSHPLAHRVGDRLRLDAVLAGREMAISRNSPDFVKPGRTVGAPLGDPFVSRSPLRFLPGSAGGIRLVVAAEGTPVVVSTPVKGSVEIAADELALGVPIELAERIVLLLHLHEADAVDAPGPASMVGHSDAIRHVRTAIDRVVDLSVPVLIRGETGTGKEL